MPKPKSMNPELPPTLNPLKNLSWRVKGNLVSRSKKGAKRVTLGVVWSVTYLLSLANLRGIASKAPSQPGVGIPSLESAGPGNNYGLL